MLRLLKAKMYEKNITNYDIAALIGKTDRAVRSKMSEATSFTLSEATLIQAHYFPNMDINTLFASDGATKSA